MNELINTIEYKFNCKIDNTNIDQRGNNIIFKMIYDNYPAIGMYDCDIDNFLVITVYSNPIKYIKYIYT